MAKKAKKKMGRPSLGHEDDFRRYAGPPVRGEYGWKIYPSNEPVGIPIKQKHVNAAAPKSPSECIVGLAVSDFFGDKYTVEVGLTVVHVIDEKGKRRLMFKMPSALAKRTRLFDKVAFWDLPAGVYRLHAIPKAKRKTTGTSKKPKTGKGGHVHIHGKGGRRVAAKRRLAPPTRVISRGRILKKTSLLKRAI